MLDSKVKWKERTVVRRQRVWVSATVITQDVSNKLEMSKTSNKEIRTSGKGFNK